MLEGGGLCYCNQQADSFFDVSLSHLTEPEQLHASQYLIMNQRSMHEVKSKGTSKIAERLEEDGNKSGNISMTELGESVLTLDEVVQISEVENLVFHLKSSRVEGSRTVVLKKNMVEIDGITKLIIMIRDITDTVRFEQELFKKKRENERTSHLQRDLDALFSQHCE